MSTSYIINAQIKFNKRKSESNCNLLKFSNEPQKCSPLLSNFKNCHTAHSTHSGNLCVNFILFRVNPRHLVYICRRFGTLYQFHLQRQIVSEVELREHWYIYKNPAGLDSYDNQSGAASGRGWINPPERVVEWEVYIGGESERDRLFVSAGWASIV
jgi:hypothetical protein